jgi:transketolase
MKILALTRQQLDNMTDAEVNKSLEDAGFDTSDTIHFDEKIDGVVFTQGGEVPGAIDPLKLIQDHEAKIKDYVESAIYLSSLEGHEELTYTKTPFTMPDGGMYLVSILHVQGPKIKLQKGSK